MRNDICLNLELKHPEIICTGFDRPNLFITVNYKKSMYEDLTSLLTVTDDVHGPFMGGPAIVYCPTKKNVDEMFEYLRGTHFFEEIASAKGVKVVRYHAGLSEKERKRSHEEFSTDAATTVVATVAFGMGIDKVALSLRYVNQLNVFVL